MIKNPLFAVIATVLCLMGGLIMKASYIEIFASIVCVINVWLIAREKAINFLFGGIAVVCFMYIYFLKGLYAMVVLSIAQLFFNVTGWYFWVKNKGEIEEVANTSKLSVKGMITWAAITLGAAAVWSYLQMTLTDAVSPFLDALTAVIGLAYRTSLFPIQI
ncbi:MULTISPECIES: nicotinamide riboside transporter PnuC [Bacillus]|uniref:nicotinamide riboside transporter PnuC n=1 Tax=Bacillus TaxID=1386 RepID=UPI000312219E|nr:MULTISPECIES: nicotinamide riboside transporter PnuC [Bacillus]